MSEDIKELRIVAENGTNITNIFDDSKYIIPIYQRPYAWGDIELEQLIEDILDFEGENYYIGNLIVYERNGEYEVIDGQQRLTSLYLLLNCLGHIVKHNLTFACRDRSNFTLQHIKDIIDKGFDGFDSKNIEENIKNRLRYLLRYLSNKKGSEEKLEEIKKRLSKVIIFRIKVPENTDLNRYFEIMNTRGEQLEQHEILKARLMEKLGDNEKRVFATIWEDCSDMAGYVQMHFKPEERENIFSNIWENAPRINWKNDVNDNNDKSIGSKTIKDIIEDVNVGHVDDAQKDDRDNIRFESIISFPYFLLHTLKVYAYKHNIHNIDDDISLDDKKLLKSFENIESKVEDKENFSCEFMNILLTTRYLFDKYIIKREYAGEDINGKWSLKTLKKSDSATAYYVNTSFSKDNEKNNEKDNNLMIQSALRVTYTSPKAMHWITKLLIWLFKEVNDKDENIKNNNISNFYLVAEDIAKEPVSNFLQAGNYSLGTNTPHIVFNYLDYLLWKKDKNIDFNFEFRNSVEHWYPRNPSDGKRWENTEGGNSVDRFGNLCLVSSSVNSRFSNLPPSSKKDTYKDNMIAGGSLKLRRMSEATKNGSEKWKEEACKEHEEEMIKILKAACVMPSIETLKEYFARLKDEVLDEMPEEMKNKLENFVEKKYYRPTVHNIWGRVGIDFHAENVYKNPIWHPIGLFAGVLYDFKDHQIEPLVKGSPDLVIIIDIEYNNCCKAYKDFLDIHSQRAKNIEKNIKEKYEDFELLLHDKLSNKWRFLILRKSLKGVIGDKVNFDEQQYQAIKEELLKGINLVLEADTNNEK